MAPTSVPERIERFFSYFEAQHRFLADLPTRWTRPPEVYKEYGYELVRNMRLLQACTHLETLGRVAAPKTSSARARFATVLTGWSGMDDWGLVSLPELWRAVQNPAPIDDARLRGKLEEIRGNCSGALPPRVTRLSGPPQVHGKPTDASEIDRTVGETKDALRAACVPEVCRWCEVLPYFTHAAILYRDYRCGLAHEARRRTAGWDWAEGDVPYYHGLFKALPEGDKVRRVRKGPCLVIPDDFVLRALGNCVERLRAYCEAEGIDPWERGGFE